MRKLQSRISTSIQRNIFHKYIISLSIESSKSSTHSTVLFHTSGAKSERLHIPQSGRVGKRFLHLRARNFTSTPCFTLMGNIKTHFSETWTWQEILTDFYSKQKSAKSEIRLSSMQDGGFEKAT